MTGKDAKLALIQKICVVQCRQRNPILLERWCEHCGTPEILMNPPYRLGQCRSLASKIGTVELAA
jgi:hypothetical protein